MDDLLFDVYSRNAVIVDTETTGLELEDEMVEIGLLLFQFDSDSGEVMETLGEYNGLREPKLSMNRHAQAVHGIPMETLQGKNFDDVEINSLFQQAELVIAHNVEFDRPFVTRMYPEAAKKDWYCSMSGIGWKKKGFENRKLQDLLKKHRIPIENAHRALDDVKATFTLLQKKDHNTGKPYLVELIQNGPFSL